MNNLIKESLIKLKQKNITSPELDLRILLKHASKKNDEIVAASDAFFPFPDSIKMASRKGISCIIQPGGSINDLEVIKAADKLNISMIFTKRRLFSH